MHTRVQVDLRDWIAFSLGRPGPLGALLDDRPTIAVGPDATVYDLLERALEAAILRVPEDVRPDLQSLDPLRSTEEFWVLGCPAEIRCGDRKLHFVDQLGDVFSPSGDALIALVPREDMYQKREAFRALTSQFEDAIGLRAILDGLRIGVVDRVLDLMIDERVAPTLLKVLSLLQSGALFNALDVCEQLRGPVSDGVADAVASVWRTAIGAVLSRHEVACYNEFAVSVGTESIQHYWIPFSYSSNLWASISEGEGRPFLAEIGFRQWRFQGLQNRTSRTKELLTQGGTVNDLVSRTPSLRPPDLLKSDPIVEWWFRKETVALRYYLVGVFSFPETFLTHLMKKDLPNYMAEIQRLRGFESKDSDRLLQGWWPAHGESRVGDLLSKAFEKAPGGTGVALGQPTPAEFIRLQKHLQDDQDKDAGHRLVVLFNKLRNALVHGTNFDHAGTGKLVFEHRGLKWSADYESLLLAYQLLPAVLSRVHSAHRSRQT